MYWNGTWLFPRGRRVLLSTEKENDAEPVKNGTACPLSFFVMVVWIPCDPLHFQSSPEAADVVSALPAGAWSVISGHTCRAVVLC